MSLAQMSINIGIALFALLPMLLGIAAWIVTLIVIWRAMKAHESIAESLKQIAQRDDRILRES